MKTIDSDEFSVDEFSNTCLAPNPGQWTKGTFNDNILVEVEPVNVFETA